MDTLESEITVAVKIGGHRDLRERRARKTALIGIAARVVNYGIRFVSIPLSLNLLGRAQYGLWLTIGSVLIWLGLSELGISTGLVNTVARAYGREDWDEARTYVSTGFFTYSTLALLAFLIVTLVSMWPGLPKFLGAGDDPRLAHEATRLFVVCGAIWAVSFSLFAIGPLCLAFQEGYLQSYAQIGAGLVTVAILFVIARRGATLIQFALAMGLPLLLANFALGGYFLLYRHRQIRPSWRCRSASALKALMSIGGPMALVQFADVSIIYAVPIMIANRLGAAAVPMYSVPATAFVVAMSLCNNLVSPYLSAYAEAAGRADWRWIRETAIRNLTTVMPVIVLAGIAWVLLGPYIIPWWARGQVAPSRALLLGLGGFYALMTWSTTNGTLLVGLGLVKTKALLHFTVAILYVAGAWLCLPRFGLIAVPVAGCFAYSVDLFLSLPIALSRVHQAASQPRTSIPCDI